MPVFLTCIFPLVIILLPILLMRLRWSSFAIGFTTGAIGSIMAITWDIAQNGIDYGPLGAGPTVYLLRFATGAVVLGPIVWAVVAVVRRLFQLGPTTPKAEAEPTSASGDDPEID